MITLPQTPKTSKKWERQPYLDKRGREWLRKKRNVPTNLPKDFELKDADGKVYMRLTRGKPVELVGGPVGEAASAVADIEKAAAGIPHVSWTPPPVDFTPPSKSAAASVGPLIPIADVIDPSVFAMYGEAVNSFIDKPEYHMKTDDATCNRLTMITARAWPGIAISPKWAWGIAIILWHGKVIIYVVRFKLKGIKDWFSKRFGKDKDKKPVEPEAKA